MIKVDIVTVNGREFVRTVSDAGYMIERDGARYSEAYDPIGSGRTYTETDERIETAELSETEQKAMAYDILTGGVGDESY